MNNPNVPTASVTSLHPVLWVAAIAVTLLSLVGIASLTGLLPSRSEPAAVQASVAAAPTPAAVPEAAPPPAVEKSAPPAAAAPRAPALHATRKPTPEKPVPAAPRVAALPPPAGAGVPPDYAPPPAAPAKCVDCGVVAAVKQVAHEGQGTGLGAIAGGVVGGALGNNIGRGDGRTLATIAGMVGGGLLGNKLEKGQRQTVGYQVSVRFDDGSERMIEFGSLPSWRVGDRVRVLNGGLVAR